MKITKSAAIVVAMIAMAALPARRACGAGGPRSVAVFSYAAGLSARDAAYTRAIAVVVSRRIDMANGLNVVAEGALPATCGGADAAKVWNRDSGETSKALKALRADVAVVVRVQVTGGGAKAELRFAEQGRGKIVFDAVSASGQGGVATLQKTASTAALKKLLHNGDITAGASGYASSPEALRLLGEGVARVQAGADKDALKQFEAAEKAENNFDVLYFYLGKYFAVQKFDYEKAVRYLGRLTATGGGDAPAHYWLGFTYYLKGNTALAIREFESSVKLKPMQPEALIYLAVLYKERAQLDKMESYYIKALEMSPDNPAAWYNLGAVQSMMSKTPEAISSLTRALDLDCASFLPIVKNDADYMNVRRKQEFAKLVKEYSGKCGK